MSTASVEVEEEDEDKGCLIGVDIEYNGRYRPLFFAPESSMSTPGGGLTLGGSISTGLVDFDCLCRSFFSSSSFLLLDNLKSLLEISIKHELSQF